MDLHPKNWSKSPPITGPRAGPRVTPMLVYPMYLPRSPRVTIYISARGFDELLVGEEPVETNNIDFKIAIPKTWLDLSAL